MEAWLARAARTRGERPALEGAGARPDLRRAVTSARGARPAACCERGVRPGDRVALALPSDELVVALHGCLLIGAVAVPIDLRLTAAERAAAHRAGPSWSLDEPLSRPARAGVDAHAGRHRDRDVHLRHHRRSQAGRAQLRQLAVERARLGARARARSGPSAGCARCRWPTSAACRSRSAARSTPPRWSLHGRFDVDAVLAALMDPASPVTLVSLVPTMLARLLDAGLRRAAGAALGAARRRPDRSRAAGARPRGGRARRAVVRDDRGLLADRHRRLAAVRLRAADRRRRRGPGPRPGRGPRVRWPGTAGCTPATWARWTTAAACRSRAARRTRSSPAARTSRRSRSRPRCSSTRRWPTPPCWAVRTRSGARPWWRRWCCAAARRWPEGASEELRRHCAARLAAFKVPKAVELVDGLPRSTTGKLLRRELRDAAGPVRDAGDAD